MKYVLFISLFFCVCTVHIYVHEVEKEVVVERWYVPPYLGVISDYFSDPIPESTTIILDSDDIIDCDSLVFIEEM
jgi:hypothetical protein